MKHRDILIGDVHVPHAFEYADAPTRQAATGFDTKDVKKLALQLDDYSIWMLTSISPVTWNKLGGGASGATTFLQTGTTSQGTIKERIPSGLTIQVLPEEQYLVYNHLTVLGCIDLTTGGRIVIL